MTDQDKPTPVNYVNGGPQTEAGRRLLWFLATEHLPNGRYWPRAFDARMVERLAEDFIPLIEEEAVRLRERA